MSLPSTNQATTTKSANNIVNLKVRDDQCRFLQIVNVEVNKMSYAGKLQLRCLLSERLPPHFERFEC